MQCPVTFALGEGGKQLLKSVMGGGGSKETWGGEVGDFFCRKNLKFHFKKAAKLARFLSLRRVSDDLHSTVHK